ncbi:MAG: hypothetical protein IJG68_07820 [Bacilli bacterium]|nr:hypothetical protein [Bacilli bacterium]
MKKIMFIFLMLIPLFVNAESCDVSNTTVESIELGTIVGNAQELEPASIDGEKIKLDVKLYDPGDSIDYNIVVKNTTTNDIYFDENYLNDRNNYFDFSFLYEDDSNIVKPGKTKNIRMTIKYENKVSEEQLVDLSYNSMQIINFGSVIENPKTSNNLFFITIILVCSFIIAILYKYKKSSAHIFIMTTMIIIPISINALCNSKLQLEVKILVDDSKNYNRLYDIISENSVLDNSSSEFVISDDGIDFKNISSDSNGKGIYLFSSTKNDNYPVYYYRGNVNNNHVLFANYCWKIVRTTENGGIKIVYNGLPTDDKCLNTTGEITQLEETKAFNEKSNSIADIGYMYGKRYENNSLGMTTIEDNYKYGNSFLYQNGVYTLVDTISFLGTQWTQNYKSLSNYHYTCFNESGVCESIKYMYFADRNNVYYINLEDGKDVNDALNEMLTDSENNNSSNIKQYLDNWYENNIDSYSSFVDDAIWCNDRSIGYLNGWDPNGGDIEKYIYYNTYKRAYIDYQPVLICDCKNDSFTVNESSEGNGLLQYPIGLLTSEELMLAGMSTISVNYNYYLYNNTHYWTISPSYPLSQRNSMIRLGVDGKAYRSSATDNTIGVRASIVLKNRINIKSGDGTADNPYTILLQ